MKYYNALVFLTNRIDPVDEGAGRGPLNVSQYTTANDPECLKQYGISIDSEKQHGRIT